jgi:signal peptidase I
MGALMSRERGAKRVRHAWRENLEAILMAVVVALLFKTFIMEVSKIPSGSMQPTLMGNPETGVFDRVLVDKLSFSFRDPERWEIVTFMHPLERSRVMVKRLVGFGPEELKIEGGDLFHRDSESGPWSHLRRPQAVMEAMWKRIDAPDRSDWTVVEGAASWSVAGDRITAQGAGRVRFRSADPASIRDHYTDGYPHALAERIEVRNPQWGRNVVADVRLTGAIRAEAGLSQITFELTEGSRTYELALPGPAAPSDATPSIRVLDPSGAPAAARGADGAPTIGTERTERAAPYCLPAETVVRFATQNLDDELSLEIDGSVLLRVALAPSADQRCSIELGVEGKGALLTELAVWRDIHYLGHSKEVWTVQIPAGHYVMLGDNTQDSADSRDWQSTRCGRDPDWMRGNFRGGYENPGRGVGPDGEVLVRFKDQWGEVHWFTAEEADPDFAIPAPLVPRELLLGRVVAMFWPIQPFADLWRLGWVR